MKLTQWDANRLIENIIDEIKEYFQPEDIFDEEILGKWAEDNGYIKKRSKK